MQKKDSTGADSVISMIMPRYDGDDGHNHDDDDDHDHDDDRRSGAAAEEEADQDGEDVMQHPLPASYSSSSSSTSSESTKIQVISVCRCSEVHWSTPSTQVKIPEFPAVKGSLVDCPPRDRVFSLMLTRSCVMLFSNRKSRRAGAGGPCRGGGAVDAGDGTAASDR